MFDSPEIYRITTEWARQLLFFGLEKPLPDEKWLDMEYRYAADGNNGIVKVMRYKDKMLEVSTIPVFPESFEQHCDVVYLRKWGDPLNNEFTFLGYSEKLNVLVIGLSHYRNVNGCLYWI